MSESKWCPAAGGVLCVCLLWSGGCGDRADSSRLRTTPAPVVEPAQKVTLEGVLEELRGIDAQLRAISWSATVDVTRGGAEVRLASASAMLDARDRYWLKCDLTAVHTDGRREILDREMWFDGHALVSVTHRQRTWMKRAEQNDLFGVHGPCHFLGRASAGPRSVPVSESIDRGWMRELIPLEGGLLRVRAITEQFGALGVLEVDVDPARRFRIVRIAELDSVLLVPYRVYETKEWIEIDGVWLPSRGTVTASKVAASADEMNELLAAAKRAGFARLSDWTVEKPERLKELRSIVRSQRAGKPLPVAPSGEGEYRVKIEYHGINEQVVVGRSPAPPVGYTIADALSGDITYPDGTRIKEGEPVPARAQ